MNPRATATLILSEVILEERSLTPLLEQIEGEHNDPKDRPLIQAICYGVLRGYPRLNTLSQQLLKKPLKKKDFSLHLLILIGLYQLIYMRIPEHATVMETVKAIKDIHKKYRKDRWPAQLVNGVLRNFLRNKEQLLKKLDEDTGDSVKDNETKFSHPNWLIEKIKTSWPNNWNKILEANNQHPPMTLRVNLKKTDRNSYMKRLEEAGIAAEIISDNHSGIMLKKPIDINKLPMFWDGYLSIQDAAPQLAADLLDLKKQNLRILDACAAPGGKTAHILESASSIKKLVIIEKDPKRAEKISENFNRLGLSSLSNVNKKTPPFPYKIIIGDATKPKSWWDGELFDRILLDAPCSATGVIRRHPDIKLLRKEDDIEKLSDLQLQMLNALWKLLKPGGLLLYATCSIMPEENALNITRFLKHQESDENKTDSDKNLPKEKIIKADWGIAQRYGRQIFPGVQDNIETTNDTFHDKTHDDAHANAIATHLKNGTNRDGFYYCLLEKR